VLSPTRSTSDGAADLNLGWLGLSGCGALVLGLSVTGAARDHIPAAEARVFHAVNGLPRWLYGVVWLPMQLGNLVVGTLAGLVVAWLVGDLAVAIGVLAAMGLKLVTERFVRKEMAPYLAVRQRPAISQVGAVIRGDVPTTGPSFPSGHVILVAAIAGVVTPALPAEWSWVPWLLAATVMFGRVYVGAHNPLDVTAGLGTGMVLGGVLALFVG
jgi:membrane-associated phospholipid phosphatase